MLGTFGMVGMAYGASQVASSAAAGDAARAKSKVGRVERELRVLKANLAKSMMINEALWELIRDKHGLTTRTCTTNCTRWICATVCWMARTSENP